MARVRKYVLQDLLHFTTYKLQFLSCQVDATSQNSLEICRHLLNKDLKITTFWMYEPFFSKAINSTIRLKIKTEGNKTVVKAKSIIFFLSLASENMKMDSLALISVLF